MLLRSQRLSLRSWTFHDDELVDEWPSYNDPIEPLWNLPRQASLSGEPWSFFEGSALRRTWAVEDRTGRLVGRTEADVAREVRERLIAEGHDEAHFAIVGSGPNATILHYEASRRQMKDGELLLVDAAANFQGYTIDITRTYPVNGKFTQAQKDIYRVILSAQEAGIKAARAGNTQADITKATADVAKAGLFELGLITDKASDQYRLWYTHGVMHWIGVDVHDAGDYARKLEPGMAFVVEPGIYVRPQALDTLPDTPENRAFKAAVAPAVARYKDIGVRIEDSFLLTETGLKNLSAKVPKSIDDVERVLGSPSGNR